MASLLLQGPCMAMGVCVNDMCPWLCWAGWAVSKAVVLLVCSRSEMKIFAPHLSQLLFFWVLIFFFKCKWISHISGLAGKSCFVKHFQVFSAPFFPLYRNRCTALYFPLLPVVLRLHSKTAKAFLFVVFEGEEKNPQSTEELTGFHLICSFMQ